MVHNEIVAKNLETKGYHPMILPIEYWDGTWTRQEQEAASVRNGQNVA